MATVNRTLAAVLAWSTLAIGCSASTSDEPTPNPMTVGGAAGTAGTIGAAGVAVGGGGAATGEAGAAGSAGGGAAGSTGGSGGADTVGGAGGDSAAGAGGVAGMAGAGGSGGAGGGAGAGGAGGGSSLEELDDFSFFVTSQVGLIALAPDENGFGGDLRFGEATGLAGADKICTTLAEQSMPGSGAKQWRAFLSTTAGGENDGPVHAIERIGDGPWYDRNGRLVAMDVAGLIGVRPDGDEQAIMDLVNELGEPNHFPGGIEVDNHDTLTGSNDMGQLESTNSDDTCGDWTRNDMPLGEPMMGHSWPRNPDNFDNGAHWMSEHNAQGCLPKVNTENDGGGPQGCDGVGCGGGYGGIYCFALNP